MSPRSLFVAAAIVLAGCQPATPLGIPPDRACIPEWPEACLGPEGSTGADPDAAWTCPEGPEPDEDERSVYACLPRPSTGPCPEPDSDCAREAFERQWIVDCRDCLREQVEVACGPDPEATDACCYRLLITDPESDC